MGRDHDKAVDIINKFINVTDDYKQCALIYVEGMIEFLDQYCEDVELIKFYNQVKNKIEML